MAFSAPLSSAGRSLVSDTEMSVSLTSQVKRIRASKVEKDSTC